MLRPLVFKDEVLMIREIACWIPFVC